MRTAYDPEADAAYFYVAITIARGGVARMVVDVLDDVNINLDGYGCILGIEVFDARARLLPETLAAAERLDG